MTTKLLLCVSSGLLAFHSSSLAFLGDDKAAIDREYGAPTSHGHDAGPDQETWIYHCKAYRVVVDFRDGKSVSEGFFRLDYGKSIPQEAIEGFLKAHAAGRTWQALPSRDSMHLWFREGALASYDVEGKQAQFSIMAYSGTTAEIDEPAASLPPHARAGRVVAIIEGNGDKASDPFPITAEGGFTVEYQTAGPYLGLTVHRAGDKKEVADANIKAPGKDHTFVASGPGTYFISVIATSGNYTITVRE